MLSTGTRLAADPDEVGTRMGCLFASLMGCFPRMGTLISWLGRPNFFSAAFGGAWL
jgi:hypothetical protein